MNVRLLMTIGCLTGGACVAGSTFSPDDPETKPPAEGQQGGSTGQKGERNAGGNGGTGSLNKTRESQQVLSEQNGQKACPSEAESASLHGSNAAGDECSSAADCQPVCCSCEDASGAWLAAVCVNGQCADKDAACGRSHDEKFCGSGLPGAASPACTKRAGVYHAHYTRNEFEVLPCDFDLQDGTLDYDQPSSVGGCSSVFDLATDNCQESVRRECTTAQLNFGTATYRLTWATDGESARGTVTLSGLVNGAVCAETLRVTLNR